MADDTSPAWLVVTTLTTPAGAPARCITSPIHKAVSGVSRRFEDAGATGGRAGAILRVAIAAGKFHGVIMQAHPWAGGR